MIRRSGKLRQCALSGSQLSTFSSQYAFSLSLSTPLPPTPPPPPPPSLSVSVRYTYIARRRYLLRLLASRNKGKFVKAVMNVIDVLAIAPFYITLITKLISGGQGTPRQTDGRLLTLILAL